MNLFQNYIKSDWIKSIKAEDLKLVNKSFVTSDYKDRECDIVYEAKINESKVIFYILLEFQSSIDYTMPLRILIYISEILREHAKNAEHKKYDKNIKIPAVVPIVLYNGEMQWDVEQEFRKIIDNEEIFGDGLINFKYDIFDVNNDFTKEDLIKSNSVTSAIFLLDQKIDEIEFLQRIKVIALFFNS
ncbi:MAG: Rpn family recombination-promoting nuclease/putative transposase, partial [Paraclostridium sp.]